MLNTPPGEKSQEYETIIFPWNSPHSMLDFFMTTIIPAGYRDFLSTERRTTKCKILLHSSPKTE